MLDLYEAVRSNPGINRLEIGEFLFAEFTCGLGDEQVGLWAHQDYLVHVLTGRKTWQTPEGTFAANPGETLFFKKGAAVVEQHLESSFCLLMFFIPDDLIRTTVHEIVGSLTPVRPNQPPIYSAARVVNDAALSGFFSSMREYFAVREKPSELLLRLKLKELILSILTGGRNPALEAYFRSVADSDAPSIAEIMDANFRFNLSLEEFARLSHRSLSSFKREFHVIFRMPPGKWLLIRRLDYASALLRSSHRSITKIAFESGFEDVSHFSRAFKDRFAVSPMAYREQIAAPA